MFLGYQGDKIKFYTEEPLDQILYNLTKIEETEQEYVLDGDEYILKDAEYIAKELQKAKELKYQEANSKANEYLQSGEALFPFTQNETTYHIEATDGNIAKIGLKSTALLIAQDFETTFPWNTKEDINIEINALEGKEIAEGLGLIQDSVWTLQFPGYITQIDNAQTIEEVNTITIEYNDDIPTVLPENT